MIIPESVTSLQDHCFDGCIHLKNIQIPSTLVHIGDFVFIDCGNLININIPSSVAYIGNNAFKRCKLLEKMIIPKSVTSIGDNFICGCVKLNKIIIPSSVKNLGKQHFKSFCSLKEFIIPSCVTRIYESAFIGCSSLEKIEIPSSVTSIERFAFRRCTSLNQITIPSSITSIEDGTFAECSSLKTVNIPDSVTYIGFDVFQECKSLTNITIPSSVKQIGFTAFKECTSLKKIVYKKDIPNLEIMIKLPKELEMVTIGDSKTGKSCFIYRYLDGIFHEEIIGTTREDEYRKDINIQGNKINFMIWDTIGAQRDMNKKFINSANVIAILFDINNPETFNGAKYFLKEVSDCAGSIPIVLIGNKCDLEYKVGVNDIRELEKEYDAKYFEVSAKTGYNIEEVFDFIITEAINNTFEEKNRILNLISNDEKNCIIY